jgi:cytochrome c oxidase subunit 1
LQGLNDWITASAYCIGISMLVFIANLIYSLVFRREVAEENPWQSKSIEWMLPSPVPRENFETIPRIVAGPYGYGVKDSPPVAILGPAIPAVVGK